MSDNDSCPLSVVVQDLFDNPLLIFQEGADRLGLPITAFNHQPSGRLEKWPPKFRQAPIEIQSIHTAIKR